MASARNASITLRSSANISGCCSYLLEMYCLTAAERLTVCVLLKGSCNTFLSSCQRDHSDKGLYTYAMFHSLYIQRGSRSGKVVDLQSQWLRFLMTSRRIASRLPKMAVYRSDSRHRFQALPSHIPPISISLPSRIISWEENEVLFLLSSPTTHLRNDPVTVTVTSHISERVAVERTADISR
jgi:hypothetical protein